MRRTLSIAGLLIVFMSPSASGHGGGLDSNGCHTNRKTGEYHCHRGAPAAPQSSQSGRSPSSQLTVRGSTTTGEKDLVRAAQILLCALGYQPSMLGTLDERTSSAVRAFQTTEDVTADGVVDAYLILRLAEKIAATCPAR